MATRSTIGILKDDGTVAYIYCHFDGYISGVGATLKSHFSDASKVEQLVANGDVSGFSNEGVPGCYADTGQRWCKQSKIRSVVGYIRQLDDVEFVYLFADGKWFVVSGNPEISYDKTIFDYFSEI